MNKPIIVTIGDIDGIGLEILLNIWTTNKFKKFILISNIILLKQKLKSQKIKIPINKINDIINLNKVDFNNHFNVFDIKAKNNDDNTYKSLINSYILLKTEKFTGVLTLPLNKQKIIENINKKFVGQTELFMKLDNKKYANMIFVYKQLIFSTLTTHIKIKNITKILSKKDLIYNKILNLDKTLKNDFNIHHPKHLIAGINPHAGENNSIGNEEQRFLNPAIKRLKKKKILIEGPYSADSMLISKNMKNCNSFIFNYHDQALIPFKIISKNSGINYTAGLSILRVSPDHGTAYDIVGKNIAKVNGVLNCIKLLKKLSINRKNLAKS